MVVFIVFGRRPINAFIIGCFLFLDMFFIINYLIGRFVYYVRKFARQTILLTLTLTLTLVLLTPWFDSQWDLVRLWIISRYLHIE